MTEASTTSPPPTTTSAPARKTLPFPPELRLSIYAHLPPFTLLTLSHTSRSLHHELSTTNNQPLTLHAIPRIRDPSERALFKRLYETTRGEREGGWIVCDECYRVTTGRLIQRPARGASEVWWGPGCGCRGGMVMLLRIEL
ncbi:hypothetical protein BJ508DRAFT_416569 [Ascobolus immersus RN42]|uniref:F-box domain-containing protein n=1 Tax=Ascobolus immersus RN42 TaxID=1160509 RepID=A0A3N4HXB1_ASCIM|nr:hypothetical protein BJ508DRAFT_416569 [Ascobolus immersus RN42]